MFEVGFYENEWIIVNVLPADLLKLQTPLRNNNRCKTPWEILQKAVLQSVENVSAFLRIAISTF